MSRMKKATVLLNMGDASSLFEVEGFLKNMFADEHILRIKSRFIRKMTGNFIVNKQLDHIKNDYAQIGGRSLMISHTANLIEKLNQKSQDMLYTYAMRYTPPYAPMVIAELQRQKIREITLLSLYPQYSTTTTSSSLKDFKDSARELGFKGEIKEIIRLYEYQAFLQCNKNKIIQTLNGKDSRHYTLLLVGYGLPKSLEKHDEPYQRECENHAKALRDLLFQERIEFENIILSYHSRIDSGKSIQPTTSQILRKMQGKKLLVYPLSFTIDNFQTHFELDIKLAQKAQEYGVEEFLLCECLNDEYGFVDFILDLSKGAK